MSVKVRTFTITVPGHITRRSKDNGTELEITGHQARYLLESLNEVAHLMPEDEPEPQHPMADGVYSSDGTAAGVTVVPSHPAAKTA